MEQPSGLIIDWRLLLIQAGNFLLLLGILSALVWKPLVRTIDERRKMIADSLAAAEAQKKAAEEARKEHEQRMEESKVQAQKLTAQARAEVAAARAQLKIELAAQEKKLFEKSRQEALHQKNQMTAQLHQEAAELITQAIAKLADHLNDSPENLKKRITQSIRDTKEQA